MDDQMPPWAWPVGIAAVLGLILMFFVLRAHSADYWAEDGAYGPAATAQRRE